MVVEVDITKQGGFDVLVGQHFADAAVEWRNQHGSFADRAGTRRSHPPLQDLTRHKQGGNLDERLLAVTEDIELKRAIEVSPKLVRDGFGSVLWCRYVATDDYVAQLLRERFGQGADRLRDRPPCRVKGQAISSSMRVGS